MNYYSSLFQKINKKTAKIGIIGLGYVGLPLTLQFSKKKFEVLGFDIDIEKINLLNNNKSYIKHISSKIIKRNRKNLTFTSSFNQISKVDIIILCLPTPLTLNLKPDLSYIKKTMLKIKRYLENGKLIILESSTYPGSTKDLILPFLKKFKVGHNFFVGYSPEREDPNNKKYNLENIPKICSGYSTYCKKLTSHLYKKILKKVKNVTDINVAEFVKLYENIYRSVNIGLVNELKIVATELGLNIYEIIEAAKTKPFGFQAFYPGPGVGGHCIPIDPYYLSWISKKKGINTKLIYEAGKINSKMPKWIISKTLEKTNLKKVLLVGVAYKKGVDDTREAPAIDFIKQLTRKNVKTDYYDPNVKFLKSRKLSKVYKSIVLNKKLLPKYNCVFIITDHNQINYNLIKKYSKLIVDTRNVYTEENKKILKF